MTLKEERALYIQAENYIVKNRLELGAILNAHYTNDNLHTPIKQALIEVFVAGYKAKYIPTEDQPEPECDNCKELEDKIEMLEETIKDFTDL
jgi:hypothetical protein